MPSFNFLDQTVGRLKNLQITEIWRVSSLKKEFLQFINVLFVLLKIGARLQSIKFVP